MSIATELTELANNLSAAKNAVTNMGGSVGDTGLAGLAGEIDSIPSGGGGGGYPELATMQSDYGVLFFWDDMGTNFEALYTTNCTIERIDQAALTNFVSVHCSGTDHLELYFDSQMGGWMIMEDYQGTIFQNVEDLANNTGIFVLAEPGITYASASISAVTAPTKNAKVAIAFLTSTEYNNLTASSWPKTIGGASVVREAVYRFSFGTQNTSVGNYFLQNTNVERVDFDYATNLHSIGNYFLAGCRKFNSPIDFSPQVSIGTYFLNNCQSFNSELNLTNVTSVGNYFLSQCTSFNKSISIPKTVGTYFMNQCYAFNQPIAFPSTWTSIPDYFMYSTYAFNQPVTIPSNITSIGKSFLSGSTTNSDVPFNKPVTFEANHLSIGANFLGIRKSFNLPLDLSHVSSIGSSFLVGCRSFNQPLDFSSVTTIGTGLLSTCTSFNSALTNIRVTSLNVETWLAGCESFTQPLDLSRCGTITFPNNTGIGGFKNMDNWTGPLLLGSANVTIGSGTYTNYWFTIINKSDVPAYTTGITIKGTNRSAILNAYSNLTGTTYYRKLVDGGA